MSKPWGTGSCACEAVRYELIEAPLIIHACHCLDCKKLSGAPFATNLWILSSSLQIQGELKTGAAPTGSGAGQEPHFCPQCGSQIYARFKGAPDGTLFLRGGTLDQWQKIVPDVHIHTRNKLPWVVPPEGVPVFEDFYKLKETWSAESLARLRKLRD